MPISMNTTMQPLQPSMSPLMGGARNNAEWQKSKYLLKYMYKTEGRDGNEVYIQLPGIIGLENVKLQDEYDNGSDVADQIKRQNELTQDYLAKAQEYLKEEGDAIDIEVENSNGMVVARIFIPENKKDKSLEKSANNFYHTDMKFVVRRKNAA